MASVQELARQASKRSLLPQIQMTVLTSLFGLSPTILNLLEHLGGMVFISQPSSGVTRMSRF